MSGQRVSLVMVLTAILSGYVGWFYAKKVDVLSAGTYELRGLSVEAESEPTRLSPTIAVAKCGIKAFTIKSATEGMETAVVRASEMTPQQMACLVDQAQTEIHGEPPLGPFRHPDAPRMLSYRPLHLMVKPEAADVRSH